MILDASGRPFPAPEMPDPTDAIAPFGWRHDRWENPLTGIGTGGDKTTHGHFAPVWRVLDQELTSLHSGSDLAAKIVDDRPHEMFRRGYESEAESCTASETKAVDDYCRQVLQLDRNLRDGMKWGRLYGGYLLVMNIDDGRAPYEPLDEKNIRSFTSISAVDRRFAFVQSQYSNMGIEQVGVYGDPEIYLISNAVAASGWNSYGAVKKRPIDELRGANASIGFVHESRTIRFDGIPADVVTMQSLAGWSWSVLQRVYNTMRSFDHAFDSVGYLLSDASQGVFKLQGIVKAISAGRTDYLRERARYMEMTRSVARGIMLDVGTGDGKNQEAFERVPTPMGGLADILEKWMSRLSSAADMPQTKLFGRSPAGMNATGESDMRTWYGELETEQADVITPKIQRVRRLVCLARKGPIRARDVQWEITHKPLWSPTDEELAKTRLANAQRDTIYIGDGVVRPEEVAVDLEEVYPNLDVKAREDVLKAGEKFIPYPEAETGADPETGEAPEPDPNAIPGAEPLSPATPVALVGPQQGKSPPVVAPAKARKTGLPTKAPTGAGGAARASKRPKAPPA